MALIPYAAVFPMQAQNEIRTLTFGQGQEIPADEYGLLESYCADPSCDCRRVMLNVMAREQRRMVATISYGFEPDNSQRGPFLDPLNPQSGYAAALLEVVADMLAKDDAYARRLQAHYRQIKQAARAGRIQPGTAPGEPRRGLGKLRKRRR